MEISQKAEDLLILSMDATTQEREASDVLSAPCPAQPVNSSATAVISAVNLFFI